MDKDEAYFYAYVNSNASAQNSWKNNFLEKSLAEFKNLHPIGLALPQIVHNFLSVLVPNSKRFAHSVSFVSFMLHEWLSIS